MLFHVLFHTVSHKKTALIAAMLWSVACTQSPAQPTQDLAAVEAAVRAFAHMGDVQDADGLDRLLHPQFRAVVNRLFGSDEVSIMDKNLYLQLIRDEKIGGDQRQVHLVSVDVVNNQATVHAVLEGKALRFVTFVSLIKTADGRWQVVGDLPDIAQMQP
ncbi:MAG: hypothetical protein OHK0039_24200 [Bacteroidia bacterium]